MTERDVLIPRALLRDPGRFGGAEQRDCLRGRPVWRDDRLVALAPPQREGPATMLLPRLVEAHCHLDKCHTLSRVGSVGGDLAAAIAAQAEVTAARDDADLQACALRGLEEARQAGCALVRSHVDWGEGADPSRAWHLLTEMGAPDVQWAALTGIDRMADEATARAIADHVAKAGGVLGSFVLDHDPEVIRAGLANIFAQADRRGLMLDFHVDEGLGDHNGLEAIADMALSTRYEGAILCGHAVSLMNRAPDAVARIAEKLARAGIAVCALPTTNLYLQGRTDGTPDRRGLTRLRELAAAGVRVIVGSDNVGDAFCPVGQHDPMAALHLAVLSAHLDPPLGRWLPMVTTDAARALGADPVHVDGAHRRELLTSDARDTAQLVAGRAALEGAVA